MCAGVGRCEIIQSCRLEAVGMIKYKQENVLLVIMMVMGKMMAMLRIVMFIADVDM